MAGRNRRVEALKELYSELPSLECQGLCSESCNFIGMTVLEQERIQKARGPRIEIHMSPCPALDFMGRCMVYEVRPLVCRMFGVHEDMPCPYGCTPERWVTKEEGREFMARAQEIGGGTAWGV